MVTSGLVTGLICLGLFRQISCTPATHVDPNPYHHEEIFGDEANYQLQWQIDFANRLVVFEATVKCQGFVGFGLSRNGELLVGSDFAIGGVHENGKPYLLDMHVGHDGKLQFDQFSQDWKLLEGNKSDELVYLKFSRKFETVDKQDIKINDDLIHIIWAFGDTEEIIFSKPNFGIFKVYLLDPDITTAIATNTAFPLVSPNDPLTLQPWAATATQKVPPYLTSRICSIIKSPSTFLPPFIWGGGKYFAYGGGQELVGEILISRCTEPGSNGTDFFEKHANSSGMACQSEPVSNKLRQLCGEKIFVLGNGGKPYYFGKEYGFSFTENEYFLLEVSYNNPEEKELEIKTGLSLIFNSFPTKVDPGIIEIGSAQRIIFDAGTNVYPLKTIFGQCKAQCNKNTFIAKYNQMGFKIYAVLMMMGQFGRKIRIRHFRNNKELSLILSDGNYDFQFQQIRSLRKEVIVLAGDQITVECSYDIDGAIRNATIHQIEEECRAYLFTNQKIANAWCINDQNYYTEVVPTNTQPAHFPVIVTGNYITYPSPAPVIYAVGPFQYQYRPTAMPVPLIFPEYKISSSLGPPQYTSTPISIPPPQRQSQHGYIRTLRKRKSK